MRRLSRSALRACVVVEGLIALSIIRDVANVTTTRLYLANRIDGTARSEAAERFDIEASRVVPQIAIRRDEQIAFHVDRPWPSTVHVDVRPSERARYEVRWREPHTERVLAQGESSSAATITAEVPAGSGELAFDAHGAMTWVDPRMVSTLRIWKRSAALVLVGALTLAIARKRTARAKQLFGVLATSISIAIALASLEAGLRALGDRAPAAILAERHDLGEVRKDTRWQLTERYGRRLRPRVNDMSEWRYGDIIRMGFIPAAVSDGALRRFRFQTDAEGIRNTRTRDPIDIAALGDSFTDAMTIDEAAAWPRLIERDTGLTLQNYGTAGFGPQQEFRVLTDYALVHRPKVVVLAYFAGNDIFEAEAFDEYERSHGAVRKPEPGWPIKRVVSRADAWFISSAFYAARGWVANRGRAEAMAVTPADRPTPAIPQAIPFDRGMFTVTVKGQRLRWAFMPPYLNTLRLSENELSARQGWALTKASIRAMRDASRAAGAELMVMFLPFKSQMYLPVAAAAMTSAELTRALRYSLPDGAIDLAAMSRNRLAQNRMMRRFCDDAGIPFLDMTNALTDRLQSGVNVYFPDDSHLNEAGHAVVASELVSFLERTRGRSRSW